MNNESKVFDRTIQLMRDRLNLSSLNHRVVSSNLANLNTPGFKARELSFEETLKSYLGEPGFHMVKSDAGHLAPDDAVWPGMPVKTEEIGAVNLEQEMMKLTRNSIEYQFITTMLNKKFSMLRQAISEGGQ